MKSKNIIYYQILNEAKQNQSFIGEKEKYFRSF